MFEGIKGPGEVANFDGSTLRVAIVHARWNMSLITPLVEGARKKLLEGGVKESNIVIQSVPGSWELPVACQRLFAASQVQASSAPSGDLLGGLGRSSTPVPGSSSSTASAGQFDSIIAIGVLIKGDTVHFEHIAESVSRGLMRIQLDFGVPVIFGLLTVLNEEQAKKRAGLTADGHNHGDDWGTAAVEMGARRKQWADGIIA
ncbi:6,7-dimethyl-8-ribityllumazine synthase [Tricharina praecox]|uniref:6,7-dimethyl-8-ribityllumazine synthase n=1 Tax=Tricharina praecox TaxID=43433 RepID=UPI002220600E|nr:6,7-dimethyl-8-ribityllumazine synthase [Tricharina praecox]KAI5849963.1 6,7-dimethyl-8-ribityllumazine synthase [Tricharina praecox]